MSAGVTPPLGPVQPVGYTCVRETPGGLCGKPATRHILWDAQMENSIGCDDHFREALGAWPLYDWHPLTAECAVRGSIWNFSDDAARGRCTVSEDQPHLAAEAVVLDLASV